MRSQLADTASKIVREDESAVLLLGDIGVYAFRDLLKEFPLRAYNIGILEQSTISTWTDRYLKHFTLAQFNRLYKEALPKEVDFIDVRVDMTT